MALDTALLPTLSNDELAKTLASTPMKIAELDRTMAERAGSTIAPEHRSVDSVGQRAVDDLGHESAHRVAAGLSFGRTIGEGGMGLVRAAVQRSLGRNVAVKTLKSQVVSERATLRLLREAWVTGSLEHPNIVPVYDLGLGDDGAPIIILKLIEGSPWSEVARDPHSRDDLLEKNLRIFVQVCNAVSLAHSRGIIHRDLKLENVMIGRFGEVYLVDWGIAVSLRPDPTGRLPYVGESNEMAGTPAYMAPEMVGGQGTVLSERTDIYLLGGVLYELLVGRPPHAGDNLRQILASIVVSDIQLPSSVPRELAAIVQRACQREPAQRFGSATELRDRVEWYLRHRGSLALSDAAAVRVWEMRTADREKMHRLFAEARFGFRQALAASPDNEAAKNGLREATTIVVELELESGTAAAAAAALAELEAPPPELLARVNERRDAEQKRVADLEKLRADMDVSTGQRTRAMVSLIVGTTWAVNPYFVQQLVERHPKTPYWTQYLFSGICALFAFVVARWGRESLMKTIVNRRVLATVLVMFASQLSLEVVCHLMAVPWTSTLTLHVFCWFMSTAMFTALVDRALVPATFAFAACLIWGAAQPQHVYHSMSLANVVLLANLFFAWLRPREDTRALVEHLQEKQRERRDSMRLM